ncbi:UDP-N-acetylmuramoyl-tripeptide--D-alanyl-D-alanine ligase [Endozoicomonas sp. OPT23]|uniref:UDP-N-acetylmuramoyl-tripeptide--D-alanyl-D- alanine ligase n=1 Tax=Endozoicomonas sp. OPT23 TaxID=2072845 RepID=UPI00129B983E|nr:UDP-N-acetylmuramoyl-tripeptide--D-alanyl-D-alanine ligase [Endozoicomonas sp. OPT23]MRI35382.1 UDP-N-acetylmuramoyl-tripeptide--D-alanyl-D-alanine ligase [Endozoicomonas sp. OPT23]
MIRSYCASEISEVVNGRVVGDDVEIAGISIDTRTIKKGDFFVAIKGPNFDGHAFVAKAVESGAAAVLVDHQLEEVITTQIVVADTQQALGLLGRFNRDNFKKPLVAVTGTCGKTSVKEMLAAILSERGNTLATKGNLNNAFGVPLTLFDLTSEHQTAVVELGTSSPGEIDYISSLAKPDIAIITNAAENHLKDLVSLEGVIFEKGFILKHIKSGGVAILNRDDPSFELWQQRAAEDTTRHIRSFSLQNTSADCYASNIVSTDMGMTFTLNIKSNETVLQKSLTISFWGNHQVQNACCAALAAYSVGLSLDMIVSGLENAQPFQRRGSRYQLSEKELLIDESYNASPIATLAAIDQLSDCRGRTLMVLGDMLDLGEVAEARHRDIGAYARTKKIDAFYGFGELTQLSVAGFSENSANGRHFADKESLSNAAKKLMAEWHQQDAQQLVTILVKGSRGMEMLDVVRSLVGSEYKGER